MAVCVAEDVLFTGGQDCVIIAKKIFEDLEAKLFGHHGAVTTLITVRYLLPKVDYKF